MNRLDIAVTVIAIAVTHNRAAATICAVVVRHTPHSGCNLAAVGHCTVIATDILDIGFGGVLLLIKVFQAVIGVDHTAHAGRIDLRQCAVVGIVGVGLREQRFAHDPLLAAQAVGLVIQMLGALGYIAAVVFPAANQTTEGVILKGIILRDASALLPVLPGKGVLLPSNNIDTDNRGFVTRFAKKL